MSFTISHYAQCNIATLCSTSGAVQCCHVVLWIPISPNARFSMHLPTWPSECTSCNVDHCSATSHLVHVCMAALCNKHKANLWCSWAVLRPVNGQAHQVWKAVTCCRQDLSCTYLAHHELGSVIVISSITIFIIIVIIIVIIIIIIVVFFKFLVFWYVAVVMHRWWLLGSLSWIWGWLAFM